MQHVEGEALTVLVWTAGRWCRWRAVWRFLSLWTAAEPAAVEGNRKMSCRPSCPALKPGNSKFAVQLSMT